MKLTAEVQMMLEQKIIPFWLSLQDDHYGGFVSYVDLNLRRNEKAEKGCILNSRILWFFSEAAMLLKRPDLRQAADHACEFSGVTRSCFCMLFGRYLSLLLQELRNMRNGTNSGALPQRIHHRCGSKGRHCVHFPGALPSRLHPYQCCRDILRNPHHTQGKHRYRSCLCMHELFLHLKCGYSLSLIGSCLFVILLFFV